MNRQETGKRGENIAVKYLKTKKYKILERNCRLPFAEIDIVAQKGKTLVFVEVKTLNAPDAQAAGLRNPEDSVHAKKRLTMERAALYYANRVFQRGGSVADVRIDVISVIFIGSRRAAVRHYENALAR